MLTILLLRHGEIAQSNPRRFIGQRDLPLTELGRRQAAQWGEALAGLPIASAWCSSLVRCRETAALALASHRLQAAPLDALREISMGSWEGLTENVVRTRFPGEFERRGADLANVAPPDGESFATAQARAWNALSGILGQAEGLALVVAHAGINRTLLCQALSLPLDRLFSLGQDYAAMNILTFAKDFPPRVVALNLPPVPSAVLRGLLPQKGLAPAWSAG
jgi:broad specificity phosphatase PhoE